MGIFFVTKGETVMGRFANISGLAAILCLSGCYTPREWNPGIATPTATTLHYQREQAKVRPVETGAIIVAGLGFAAAGYGPDGAPPPRPAPPPATDLTAPVRAVEAPSAPRAEIDEEAAVRACVLAVEGEGRRHHLHALLDRVASVDPLGDGLMVRGGLRLRADGAALDELRPFRCRVDAQAVRMVAIDAAETRPAR